MTPETMILPSEKTPELAHRIVVKVGSNVVVRPDGKVALGLLYSVVEAIAQLRRQGREVLLVTSGAVALGVERIGLASRPVELARVQACAAIGQSRLMSIYDDAFANLDVKIAQILLTEDDFRDETRYANLRATLSALIEMGVVPIINENDTISTMELERPSGMERIFSDNDKLSALVMAHVGADLLILLSDVDGLYNGNPGAEGSELISSVQKVTDQIRGFAQGGNGRGRGGMASKIEAAHVAMEAGGCAVIANGRTPGIIERICAGEAIGTLFAASANARRSA
ncbi:glutamate 5-kinase [Granulicella rosea]|nr:glutamate 5-kinase [Granulicella rosea]